jgi:hypothetical protein
MPLHTQQTQETIIHAICGIRTRNLINQAAAYTRLKDPMTIGIGVCFFVGQKLAEKSRNFCKYIIFFLLRSAVVGARVFQ